MGLSFHEWVDLLTYNWKRAKTVAIDEQMPREIETTTKKTSTAIVSTV